MPVQRKRSSQLLPEKQRGMNRFRAYIDEVSDELLRKVTWPTWAELQESAIIVMIATVIFAIVVFAMDSAFRYGMGFIYGTNG